MSIFELIEKNKNEELVKKIERVKNYPLVNEVYEQLGSDNLEEFFDTLDSVTRGGANAGFPGFIYHSELEEFYLKNRRTIKELLKQQMEELGVSTIYEFVRSFNCLKSYTITEENVWNILAWNEDRNEETQALIVDALCWAVLEDLAFLADC